jgi:outer membrane lipoprotein LolB
MMAGRRSSPRAGGLRVALAGALLLSGCAALREAPPPRPPVSDVPKVWTLEGRMGVQTRDRGWQARLRWVQRGEDFHVRLSGPLGSGTADIRMSDGSLRLRDSRGGERSGAQIDAWARETFGEPLPVEALSFWLLGLPRPGRPARIDEGADGLPDGLFQAGWDVRFEEWARLGGRTLPRRLSLERGGVRVRLVVHRWQEGAGASG